MKKVVTIFIILMLILGHTISNADINNEILFRNVPWGINIDEVKKELPEFGDWITYDKSIISHWADKYEYVSGREANGWMGEYYDFSGDIIKVAGYPVTVIGICCAYGMSMDEKVLRDIESSEFCMAFYKFNVVDYEGTYQDLREKLTSLYGEGIETTNNVGGSYNADNNELKSYISTTKKTEWKGGNNTALLLVGKWDDRDLGTNFFNGVTLLYGKIDYDNMLTRIENAVKQEQLQTEKAIRQEQIQKGNRTNDTNGL